MHAWTERDGGRETERRRERDRKRKKREREKEKREKERKKERAREHCSTNFGATQVICHQPRAVIAAPCCEGALARVLPPEMARH